MSQRADSGQRTAESPGEALAVIAARLRGEDTVISAEVVEPEVEPALGLLVAAGPRAAGAPAEYATVIESVREGYLLHYGRPRIVRTEDRDLALLAGDYLYALGIELLAAIGDLEAINELSDLISLSAELHSEPGAPAPAEALWLASAVAVAAGGSREHEAGKEAVRAGRADAGERLHRAGVNAAGRAGLSEALGAAAESVGFRPTRRSPSA